MRLKVKETFIWIENYFKNQIFGCFLTYFNIPYHQVCRSSFCNWFCRPHWFSPSPFIRKDSTTSIHFTYSALLIYFICVSLFNCYSETNSPVSHFYCYKFYWHMSVCLWVTRLIHMSLVNLIVTILFIKIGFITLISCYPFSVFTKYLLM